jgi:hypothetical protein
MNRLLKTSLGISTCLFFFAAGLIIGSELLAHKPKTILPKFISLPDNVFDASIKVTETPMTFYYPSKGFYGLGASLETSRGLRIDPTAPHNPQKNSEYIIITAGGDYFPNRTLKDFVGDLKNEPFVTQRFRSSIYETINGREFYVYRLESDANVILDAVTVVNNRTAGVSMSYASTENTPDGAIESKLAYEHNDELFQEILSHLKFE